MALISNTNSRKIRLLQVQLCLALGVLLAFVIISSFYKRDLAERNIVDMRMQELKKYDKPEIDLQTVRKIRQMYCKPSELTDEQIDDMNDIELLVAVNCFLDNTDAICKRKLRMGYMSDGGWEICDDESARPSASSCLVYTFQVRQHYDFQDDVARVYGCEVHSFNPYLTGVDYNRSAQVKVHPYGIGRYSYVGPDGREFYSFPDIRSILGHLNRLIDVVVFSLEGGEWPVLYTFSTINELKHVKQLLIKFQFGYPANIDRHRRMLRVVKSINELGFRKFYVHKKARGAYHHPFFPVMQAKQYEVHFMNTKL